MLQTCEGSMGEDTMHKSLTWINHDYWKPLLRQHSSSSELLILSLSGFCSPGWQTQSSTPKTWLDIFWEAVRRDGQLRHQIKILMGATHFLSPFLPPLLCAQKNNRLLQGWRQNFDCWVNTAGGDREGGQCHVAFLPLILAAGADISSAAAQQWQKTSNKPEPPVISGE